MIYIQLSQRTKVGEAQDRSDPGLKPLPLLPLLTRGQPLTPITHTHKK